MNQLRSNEEGGQALIEVLIASAILGIIIAGVASSFTFQNSEMRSMKERLAVSDFQQQLTRSFAVANACGGIITQAPALTFSSPGGGEATVNVNLPSLPISSIAGSPALVTQGKPVSALSSNLVPALSKPFNIVGIKGSTDGKTGLYTGNLQISFNNTKLERPVQPASVALTFATSTSSGVETIVSCSALGVSQSCVMRSAQSVVKGPCGIVAEARCNAGETVKSGGASGGSNMALQNSTFLVNDQGTLIGWQTTWYDSSPTGGACSINSYPDGTTADPTNPCYGSKCGSASVLCCK